MKTFCLKAILFSFITCISLILLDVVITKGLRLEKQSNLGVWNSIYESKINSDIIINGSSRAVYHIDPLIVTKLLNKSSYNLGMDGQMFEIQYCRFKIFLEHNPPPKIVIQSVDCHTLCKTKGIYDYQQFLPFLQDSIMKNTLIELEGLSKNDFEIPMARYAGEFKLMSHALKLLIGQGDNSSDRYNGFEAQNKIWNSDLAAAKRLYPKKLEYILDKRVVKLFEKYIQYCKSNNIELILVYTPEYLEGQKFIKNRRDIITLYEKIAAKYQIPFLNYSASKVSQNRNLFYNALHLNKYGAQLFSTELAMDLKKLNKEKKRSDSFTYNMGQTYN